MGKVFRTLALLAVIVIVVIFAFMIFEALSLLRDKANYEENWERLRNTYFSGVIPKIIASLALIVSVYSIVTRRFPLLLSVMLYVVAIVFAYITPILKIVFVR